MLRLSLIALLSLASLPALAQAPRPSDVVEATLRPGWRAADGTHMAALHLRMAPGWMTYWRHPGESGIVPRLDWSGSDNLAELRIHWPEPRLVVKSGFHSIGYLDEVILPLQLRPRQPGQPIILRANLSIGVCDDICIPVDLGFTGALPSAGQPDRLISRALDSRARPAQSAGLRDIRCELAPDARGVQLHAHLDMPAQGAREFVLLEPVGTNVPSRVMGSERAGSTLRGAVQFRAQGGQVPAIDRSQLAIRIVSENGMLAHQGCTLTQ
jgi:DsbC/DsbD-like thiol-disulfide interchange protein